MSEFLNAAAANLNDRVAAGAFDGSARFDIEGEGSLILDAEGARIADEPADVTLSADSDTFRALFDGDLDPTSAFMSGKLKIDGDMGKAMQLAALIS
ncbi:SCP2 sterol-binding domain-containing protein [Pontibaca methylaminivorans]|uniref:SCP-2 sterol transfer family protein n=1 Tax=Pontibaca methylaminivorans TaxID=515897 RepID=A0A1R3WIV1_9RHOB|nr:SCP2 sterol-binding domain-containing protein [Pontibaca methylaminivorans]SIT77326.1 SCP-2 sterol transfer family protein [Pontibaca methylaminivorans]